MRKFLAALGVVAVVGFAAGCGTTHSVHHLAQKIACSTQVGTWYEKGGKAHIKALGDAVKASGLADEGLAKTQGISVAPVVRATGKLRTAITALGSDPVPGCVPGARADLSAGLQDFSRAAGSQDQLVTAVRAKNPTAAQKAGQAGSAAFKAGGMKFLAAVTALKQYLAG